MSNYYNRRKFIKLSTAAFAGGAAVLSGINYGCAGVGSSVVAWGNPGGDVLTSPDYEVTLKRGDKTWKLFTYYSYNRPVDKIVDLEGNYIKLSFLGLHSNEYKQPENNKDTYAHSWAYFDFSGGPIEVEVKILKALDGLTLPLKSCRIFPSPLGIECQIVADDTIRFTLEKPAKIAVVPNWQLAMEKLENTETLQAFEGYRNPLFLFARAPEINIPSKKTPGTLVIKPGESYGVQDFEKAKTIYFEPGVHDYSKYNPSDPYHYIVLKTGQTIYLAGGAYVYGHVSTLEKKLLISDMPLMHGRGTLSGLKNVWTGISYITNEVKNVKLDGIILVDANNHISHSSSPFRDLAVVGAWHGNTDGVTVEGGIENDPYSGWHIDDCFVMGGDTNLKFRGSARIRNYTIWQLGNAEPFWIANSNDSYVDGVFVICYNKMTAPTSFNPGQIVNFQVPVSGNMKNITVKNLYCEAPFASRLFLMQSNYTGAGFGYENILFENITVNTPHILIKSPVGLREKNASPFGKIVFRNLVINGTRVTAENCTDYFDLLEGVTPGKEIIFE
ncbi:MAG: hypothetical protein NT144_08670 [Bacteroidia bacterium]|nr:hypothetical protein [Bacteroidia bacterium]